ncbi:TIGR03986 family type III CRISPR-associated RAMP protein [Magnetococcales bacterium HHB-1]
MNEIYAPYNFVSLSNWVFSPHWAKRASYDIPSKEGLSGILDVEIKAHTPILIGGEGKETDEKEQRTIVEFFKMPDKDKTPAIPGTSLKGMIRNVIEIITFSKMKIIDDKRYGLRDISGRYVKEVYASHMIGQKAGFLRMKPDGSAEIIPCDYVRLSHVDLENYLKKQGKTWPGEFLFEMNESVKQKYEKWQELTGNSTTGLPTLKFTSGDISTPKDRGKSQPGATGLGEANGIEGSLVFTSQISDRRVDKVAHGRRVVGKYKDFIFYNAKEEEQDKIRITPETWQGFLFVHADDGKEIKESEESAKKVSGKGKNPWSNYWRARYFRGERVPVFYHTEERNPKEVRSLGVAFMYRLAAMRTVKETVMHSSSDHGSDQFFDFTELLFGTVDEQSRGENNLKGRVSFGHLPWSKNAEGGLKVEKERKTATILSGPKASYFPNYIAQDVDEHHKLKGKGHGRQKKMTYETFMSSKARVRGWKRYPVRRHAKEQEITSEQLENKKVQTVLHAFKAGSIFKGKIRFHNLYPEELGALLWALQWGGDQGKRHALGMGKPFGYGQVSITVNEEKSTVIPNDPEGDIEELEYYRELSFVEMMEEAYKGAPRRSEEEKALGWEKSKQIQQLLAMADPDYPGNHQVKLEHMKMAVKERNKSVNEFVLAKQTGLALPDYLDYMENR